MNISEQAWILKHQRMERRNRIPVLQIPMTTDHSNKRSQFLLESSCPHDITTDFALILERTLKQIVLLLEKAPSIISSKEHNVLLKTSQQVEFSLKERTYVVYDYSLC